MYPPHPLLEHIFYINLDSRPDRKEHVLREFAKIHPPNSNATIERFPAISCEETDGGGAMGCTLSHIRCLELAKERQYPYVFICEDDIAFLQPLVLQEKLQQFWENPPAEGWEVLILGGNNFRPFEPFSDYAIQVRFCSTTTGYIVSQPYYNTLLQNFRQAAESMRTAKPEKRKYYAVDVEWRKLQQKPESRWYMLIPPTVVQAENYSDIEHRYVNYSHWMLQYDKPQWEPESADAAEEVET